MIRVADHIDQVQDVLGRKMLLENPSSYLTSNESTMSETEFLREIAQRTGCGLLLDVNNVFVSATNLKLDARGYIDDFPMIRLVKSIWADMTKKKTITAHRR